jgi:superfamily I DNA/RNA helicase
MRNVLEKCDQIKAIMEEEISVDEKIEKLSVHLAFDDKEKLKRDLEQQEIDQEIVAGLEHQEEEEAELEEIEVKKMSAIELITIVGAKGLSADHVIIVGFDDVNMRWITKNAFYVALTRARKSLHLLTSLRSGGSRGAHDYLRQMPDAHLEFFSYTKGNHSKAPRTRQGFMAYLVLLARRRTR